MYNKRKEFRRLIMITKNEKTNSLDISIFKLKISVKKKNYLRKIYAYFLKKFADVYPVKKYYDYIIPVGDNCKYSQSFHYFHKFVDSTLLNWAEIYEKQYLNDIIKYPENIYTEGFVYDEPRNMWICKKYKVSFHGRSLPQELIVDGVVDETKKQEDYNELCSRLKHLIEKTKRIIAAPEKKLYVYTYEENDFDGDTEFLKDLYNLLTSMSTNFDFLVILKSENKVEALENLAKEIPNFYVRTVVPKDHDVCWAKINCEFTPKFKKKQTKKRKFELID